MYDFRERQARPFGDLRGMGPANSAFSPDGRWIAYTSRVDLALVFIQPVPSTGARYQVSAMNDLGHHPFWAPNGKELFYFGLMGNWLLSVPITIGSSATVGTAVRVVLNWFEELKQRIPN